MNWNETWHKLISTIHRAIQLHIKSHIKLLPIGLITVVITIVASLVFNTVSSPAIASPLPNATLPEVTVYRDPSCHCCGRWMEHLTAEGFQLTEIEMDDMASLKQQYGVPKDQTSCHTAVMNGYVLEGHVPIAEIKRLIAERPEIAGITVPGMPVGTPGMEDGDRRDSFTVFSFDEQGNIEPFQQYSF
jgi:hypothetical protein